MKTDTLFMETTEISAEHTCADIQRVLGKHGVTGVMTEYENGEVKAVSFKTMFLDRTIPFRLPCRWEPIYNMFIARPRKTPFKPEDLLRLQNQAKRVAWRQILRWVEAQLALVKTNMVQVHEVFLPYVQMDAEGTTLFQSIEKTKFRMLESSR